MRVRIWNAFASNNSGSYTIVGSFPTAERAREVADALEVVMREHSEWMRESEASNASREAPLHRFVRAEGLSLDSAQLGLTDDWPGSWQRAPEVTAINEQVIVHVAQTVTMPRTFGEFMYRRGGRVDSEFDHAHHALITQFTFWIANAGWEDSKSGDARLRFDALRRDLDAKLPSGAASPSANDPAAVVPVWRAGDWGMPELFAVFDDLVAGVAIVRETSAVHGLSMRLRLLEATDESADPLAALRSSEKHRNVAWQAVLWSPGPDINAVIKLLHGLTGWELSLIRERLADAPFAVRTHTTEALATEAVVMLRAAGADAEVFKPG